MNALRMTELVYKRFISDQKGFLPAGHCVFCEERCHSNTGLLCEPCLSDLEIVGPCCSICSEDLNPGDNRSSQICGRCQTKPPWFDNCFIPFKYSFPLNSLIKQLKYKDKIFFSSLLASLFVNRYMNSNRNLPDCIVPVPLHKHRLMRRGFNQADLISSKITREITGKIIKNSSLPVDSQCCQRIKPTQQQTGMKKKQREVNIRNAFAIDSAVTYKHIAILDDVVTTGSTVNELSRVFKQAGVETVEIWACAKAYRND